MKLKQLLIACSALTLAACSTTTVKDTLGIDRKAPDEFRVVSRPPLYIPPDFNLQPPTSGVASASVIPADKQAQSLVFNLKQSKVDTAVAPVSSTPLPKIDKNASSGEQQFLKNIGAAKADPKVRDELTQQAIVKQEKQEESSWWDIFSSARDKKEPLVDAKGEAARIKADKATGKPVTEGETPEVKSGDKGWFREWLGW